MGRRFTHQTSTPQPRNFQGPNSGGSLIRNVDDHLVYSHDRNGTPIDLGVAEYTGDDYDDRQALPDYQ